MTSKPYDEPFTVLVVDDDAGMRALLKDWLERDGFRVIEEPSADGLLAAAKATPLDVVVLDKEMPGSGGFDVLPSFRRQCPEVPVILITAFGGGAVAQEAMRLGARSYLEKPFQLRALLEAVRDATRDDSRRGPPRG
jgi:two-component system, NtrC family, response regulator AtoC